MSTYPAPASGRLLKRDTPAAATGLAVRAVSLGLIALAALLVAASLATATHDPKTASTNSNYVFSDPSGTDDLIQKVTFTVTNENDNSDTVRKLDEVWFKAPDGWKLHNVLAAQNELVPSCWTVNALSEAQIEFKSNGTGCPMAEGQSKTFTIRVNQTSDNDQFVTATWTVTGCADVAAVGHRCNGAAPDQPGASFGTLSKSTGVTAIGIASVQVGSPAGATDGFASTGENVTFTVTVVNKFANTPNAGIKFKITANASTSETSTSLQFEQPKAETTKAWDAWLKFSAGSVQRTLTLRLNLSGLTGGDGSSLGDNARTAQVEFPIVLEPATNFNATAGTVPLTNLTALDPTTLTARIDLGYEPAASGGVTAATTTTLTDSNALWVTNQWANFKVKITSGTGEGEVRTINSNTDTVLTLSTALPAPLPDSGSAYDLYHPASEHVPNQVLDARLDLYNEGNASGVEPHVRVRIFDANGAEQTSKFEEIRDWYPYAPCADGASCAIGVPGTVTSATTTTLTDSAADFTCAADCLGVVNELVRVTDANGVVQERLITERTSTELTVKPAWANVPASGASYQLVDVLKAGTVTASSGSTLSHATAGTTDDAKGLLVRVVNRTGSVADGLVTGNTPTQITTTRAWASGFITATGDDVFFVFSSVGRGPPAARLKHTFAIEPAPCASRDDCGSAPPDGTYNVVAEIRFWDQNVVRAGDAKTLQVRTYSGFLKMDSTKPELTNVEPGSPPALQFQRGGANRVNVQFDLTDPNVAAANVRLIVTDFDRKTTAGCPGDTAGEPWIARCVLDNFTLEVDGTTYNRSIDMAKYDQLGDFPLYVFASDAAGNWVNRSLGNWILQDTQRPTIETGPTIIPSSGNVTVGSPLQISGRVIDGFRVAGVFVKALKLETNTQFFPGDGLPMTCAGCGFSQGGNWTRTTTFGESGTYLVTLFARDDACRRDAPVVVCSANEATSLGSATVRVTPKFEFAYVGGAKAKNLTTTSLDCTTPPACNQVSGAPFTSVQLSNQGSTAQDFFFECRIGPGTNATRAQTCSVDGDPDTSGFDGSGDPTFGHGQSHNNTVNITVFDSASALVNGRNFEVSASGSTSQPVFKLEARPPPTARPGERLNLEIVAKPKDGLGEAFIYANFTVTEGVGTSLSFRVPADGGTLAGFTDDRVAKLTQKLTVPVAVRNPGNVDTTYGVSLLSVKCTSVQAGTDCTTSTTDLTSSWGSYVTLGSLDPRWAEGTNSIRLAPAGSANFQNASAVLVNLTIPNTEAPVEDITITLRAVNTDPASPVKAGTLSFQVDVREPSIVVHEDEASFKVFPISVTAGTTCEPGPASATGTATSATATTLTDAGATWTADQWKHAKLKITAGTGANQERTITTNTVSTLTLGSAFATVPDATSQYAIHVGPPAIDPENGASCRFQKSHVTHFDVQAHITSNLNAVAGQPSNIIQAQLIVTSPCGASCPSVPIAPIPMRLIDADDETKNQTGRDGIYNATFWANATVGTFEFQILAREGTFRGDQYLTEGEALFRVTEVPDTPPSLSGLKVLENGVERLRGVEGYVLNFGSNVTVRVTMTDANNTGRATLEVKRDTGNGVDFDLIDTVPLLRTPAPTTVLTPVLNATFEGTWRPPPDFQEFGGQYLLDVIGLDAMGTPAGITSQIPFFVDLRDLVGPTIAGQLVSGSTRDLNGTLAVGHGQPVNVTATIVDNADGAAGSNVNPAAIQVVVAPAAGGSEILNTTLPRVAGSLTSYNLALPVASLSVNQTYTVRITAEDIPGNVAVATLTLRVEANTAPALTVLAPTLVDNRGTVASGDRVRIGVTDANIDVTSPVAFRVELVPANGTLETITPTVTGALPSLTLEFPVTQAGRLRVTAQDILGLNTTLEFDVDVDVTAPTVAFSVDPFDLARSHVTSTATYIAPGVKLLVSGNDAGGFAAGAVRLVVQPETGEPANRTLNIGESFTLDTVLGRTAGEGRYTLNATVRDRAGNVATLASLDVVVDGTPPAVGAITPANPVAVTITDPRSGVESAEILWTASATGTPSEVIAMTESSGTWSGTFASGASDRYFLVRATDHVGNTAEQRCSGQLCHVTITNFPPTLTVSAPTNDSVVRGQEVNLSWSVTDPENAQATVLVQARSASGALSTILSAATLSPQPWDTTGLPDGNYTLVFTATDPAGLTDVVQVSVTVRNTGIRAGPIPSVVPAGQALLLSFNVTTPGKTVESVAAVVRAGGETQTVTLRDDGTNGDRTANDGVWSSSFTPRLAGQHAVDLRVTDSDGQTSTYAGVATFNAQGAGTPVGTPVTLFAVLALGVVVAVMGVFGIRRWK